MRCRAFLCRALKSERLLFSRGLLLDRTQSQASLRLVAPPLLTEIERQLTNPRSTDSCDLLEVADVLDKFSGSQKNSGGEWRQSLLRGIRPGPYAPCVDRVAQQSPIRCPASRTLCIHPFALPVHPVHPRALPLGRPSRIPGPYSSSMGFKNHFPYYFSVPPRP